MTKKTKKAMDDPTNKSFMDLIYEDNAKVIQQMLINEAESKASAWHSTSELWDDGVIDPRDTRDVLGLCISSSLNADLPDNKYGVFRM